MPQFAARCQVLGGAKLHRDLYRRKPRGGPGDLGEAYRRRVSFTCSICDKRHTPGSVRFLGRRVYLAAVVVVASAVRTSLTSRIALLRNGDHVIDAMPGTIDMALSHAELRFGVPWHRR